MKNSLLLFLSLFVPAYACAQQYDEVEFEVKKKDISKHTYYYASDTVDSKYNTRSYAYIHVVKSGDTVLYNSVYNAYKWETPLSGARYINVCYKHVGDTVFADVNFANNITRASAFIKNGVCNNGYVIASKLLPPFQDKVAKVYYGGTADIVVVDSTYKCIKLLEVVPYMQRRFLVHVGRSMLFKYKLKMQAVSIHYIREHDLLPIKIVKAEPVKRYPSDAALVQQRIEWELIREE